MADDLISKIKIDKESPVPLYYQLMEQIKHLIEDGSIAIGTQISTERELMAELHLSYNTVTRALRELVQQGILERKQGCGTFVSEIKRQHRTIAVVTPFLYQEQSEEPFVDHDLSSHIAHIIEPQLIHAIEMHAKTYDANVILYLDHGSIEIERQNLMNLIERGVDAAIILSIGSSYNDDMLQRIKEAKIPLVMVDRYSENIATNYVGSNNFSGVAKTVELLVENGFHTIHYITPEPIVTSLKERHDGYIHAINKHLIAPKLHTLPITLVTDPSVKHSYTLVRQLIPSVDKHTAFFAANSEVLTGIILAIEDYMDNYEGIGLATFDNPNVPIPDGIYFLEVMQALNEIGKAGVDIVMNPEYSNGDTLHIRLEPAVRVIDKRRKYNSTK